MAVAVETGSKQRKESIPKNLKWMYEAPLLVVPSQEITSEVLDTTPGLTPEFLHWANGSKALLNSMTAHAVRMGRASNRFEALSLFNKLVALQPLDDLPINSSDIAGNARTGKRSQYKKRNGQGGEADPRRRIGTVGHGILQEMVTHGQDRDKPNSFIETQVDLAGRGTHQLSFFDMYQLSEGESGWNRMSGFPGSQEIIEVLRGEHVPARVLRKLRRSFQDGTEVFTTKNPLTQYSDLKRITSDLRPFLAQVVGTEPLDKISMALSDTDPLLPLQSILSITGAVLHADERGRQIIFPEVPIFPLSSKLRGWRADGFVVRSIDGREPNDKEYKKLNKLARTKRLPRTELVQAASAIVGAEVKLEPIDWKIGVGDGIGRDVISLAQVRDEPISKHAGQMVRYVTLSEVADQLNRNNTQYKEWFAHDQARAGSVVYIGFDGLPVEHKIQVSPARLMTEFSAIASRMPRAGEKAIARKVENYLLGVMEAWERGKEPRDPKRAPAAPSAYTIELPEVSPPDLLSDALTHYGREKYVDEAGLIIDKGVNKNNEPRREVHGARLEEGIKSGRILVGDNFSETHGGSIQCIDPDHSDSDPSMSYNRKAGYVHCFRDGVTWYLDKKTIPEDMLESILEARAARKGNKGLESYHVPERMLQIMGISQLLQNSWFEGSPAEEYLATKRKLDPELAWAMGAGYGQKKLVLELMELGFSYDEMLESGIVKLGTRMNHPANVMRELGIYMNEADMVRKHPKFDGPGYPFLMMGGPWQDGQELGRLTFPLQDHLGNVNSFYGRRIDGGDTHKHFKLTTPWSHGAFNSAVLQEDGERFLVESPLEALAVMEMMGTKNVMGMIGIRNFFINEMILRSPGDWTVAFNWDRDKLNPDGTIRYRKDGTPEGQAGQRAAAALLEKLSESGNEGRYRNLTAELMAADGDPRFIGFNDYNDFLAHLKSPEYILSQIH